MNVAPDGDEEKRKRKNITLTEEKHNGTLIISKIMMRKNLENRDNFSDEMLSIINSTGTFKGDQVKPISRSRFMSILLLYMFIVMFNYDDVSLAMAKSFPLKLCQRHYTPRR